MTRALPFAWNATERPTPRAAHALLVMIVAALVSGCVDSGQQSPDTDADSPGGGVDPADANESVEADPVTAVHGLAGQPVTKGTEVSYYVNATGPVAVNLRWNGTVVVAETIEGNQSWTFPLAYGRHELNVSLDGPGYQDLQSLVVVRLARTELEINYCRYHPSSPTEPVSRNDTLWIDVDSRPSEPLYTENGTTHADAYTAHDQIHQFSQATGVPIEVTYFPDFQGFFLDTIDGAPETTAGGFPFWELRVNGQEATGMSLREVAPGDVVSWTLTPCN